MTSVYFREYSIAMDVHRRVFGHDNDDDDDDDDNDDEDGR